MEFQLFRPPAVFSSEILANLKPGYLRIVFTHTSVTLAQVGKCFVLSIDDYETPIERAVDRLVVSKGVRNYF